MAALLPDSLATQMAPAAAMSSGILTAHTSPLPFPLPLLPSLHTRGAANPFAAAPSQLDPLAAPSLFNFSALGLSTASGVPLVYPGSLCLESVLGSVSALQAQADRRQAIQSSLAAFSMNQDLGLESPRMSPLPLVGALPSSAASAASQPAVSPVTRASVGHRLYAHFSNGAVLGPAGAAGLMPASAPGLVLSSGSTFTSPALERASSLSTGTPKTAGVTTGVLQGGPARPCGSLAGAAQMLMLEMEGEKGLQGLRKRQRQLEEGEQLETSVLGFPSKRKVLEKAAFSLLKEMKSELCPEEEGKRTMSLACLGAMGAEDEASSRRKCLKAAATAILLELEKGQALESSPPPPPASEGRPSRSVRKPAGRSSARAGSTADNTSCKSAAGGARNLTSTAGVSPSKSVGGSPCNLLDAAGIPPLVSGRPARSSTHSAGDMPRLVRRLTSTSEPDLQLGKETNQATSMEPTETSMPPASPDALRVEPPLSAQEGQSKGCAFQFPITPRSVESTRHVRVWPKVFGVELIPPSTTM